MRGWVIVAVLWLGGTTPAAGDPVTVFAAASLKDAMEAASEAWRDRGGEGLRLSFAASSTLARQIEAGAPADIYASADARWMDRLEARGLVLAATRTHPIANRLVLVAPEHAATGEVVIEPDFDLPALVGPGERLAVGDPAHVPAGRYARAALEHFGWWRALESRLARADDVRAALALVARGEAPLGVVYATDAAITDHVRVLAVFPAESHPPILYPFAIVADGGGERVARVFAFLTGAEALAIYARFGFETE